MGKLPDRRTIKRLYETLKDAPPNLASLVVRPDGSFEAQFRQQGEPGSSGPHTPAVVGSTPAPATKLVPGSIFPDDQSPIDAADLTLNPIDLSDEAN